jgi:hypothetical protein
MMRREGEKMQAQVKAKGKRKKAKVKNNFLLLPFSFFLLP